MNKVIKSYLFIGVFAIVSMLGMALNTHVAFAASPCVIDLYTITASTVDVGTPVTLNWQVSNCTDMDINGYPVHSSVTLTPTVGGTYDFTFTAKSTVTNTFDAKTITLVVNNNTAAQNCTIDSFTSNTKFVDAGKPVTFYFTTTGCNTTVVSDENGVSGYTSPYTTYPTKSGTYVLSATNTTTGLTKIDNIYITVNSAQALPQNPPCIISNFYASPSSIQVGDSSMLHWTTNGLCKLLKINNSLVAGTSQYIDPTSTTTYTISGQGTNSGTQPSYQTTTVFVNQQNNSNNNNNNQTVPCVINNFYANPSTISGGSSMLYWTTNGNCTSLKINDSLVAGTSQYVDPSKTTTYTISGFGSGNSYPQSSRSTTVFVNPIVSNTVVNTSTTGHDTGGRSGNPPTVTTNQNAQVTGTTVLVTGTAFANGDSTVRTWFEYGVNTSFGLKTDMQLFGIQANSAAQINNLSQYTKYYYRLVAQNLYGTTYGSTYSFTSGGPLGNSNSGNSTGNKNSSGNLANDILNSSLSNKNSTTTSTTTTSGDTTNSNNNSDGLKNPLPANASNASSKGGFNFMWLLVLVIVILIIIIVTRSMRLKAKEADGEDHHHVAHH